MLRRTLFLLVSFFLVVSYPLWAEKVFSIIITPPAGAIQSEIEFSNVELSKNDDTTDLENAKVLTVRTQEKTFRQPIDSEFQFFRLRSIHKTGVAGPFSETRRVEDYLQNAFREPTIPVVQQGQTEYLLGSRIELKDEPGLTTQYSLDGGSPQTYKEAIIFTEPATHTMEISIQDAQGATVYKKQFIFKVELTPPTTQALIASPAHNRDGIVVGKESSVVLMGQDAESGLDQTFYRILSLGEDMQSVAFEPYGRRLSWSDFSKRGRISLLQYYSVDKAKNKEALKTEIIYSEIP